GALLGRRPRETLNKKRNLKRSHPEPGPCDLVEPDHDQRRRRGGCQPVRRHLNRLGNRLEIRRQASPDVRDFEGHRIRVGTSVSLSSSSINATSGSIFPSLAIASWSVPTVTIPYGVSRVRFK